jgi:hypothetical protein
LAIEKLKSHKSPSIVQIPTELRQGVEQFAMRSTNLLTSIWNVEELPEECGGIA